MYTLQNTLNATLALEILAVTSDIVIDTDVDREPQRYVTFINNLQSLSSHCDGWLHFGLSMSRL